MSVVWASRLLHRDMPLPRTRVPGPDLFLDVLAAGQAVGLKHYLLGSTPQVIKTLESEVRRRFPAVRVVGVESPPFRALTIDEERQQVDRIVCSDAHIVWLGLGTPKQDWEAARLAARVPAVLVCVGAAFDFVAGTKWQAPGWMQSHALEWFFRLMSEPTRLWRRYLFSNARFLLIIIREYLGQLFH